MDEEGSAHIVKTLPSQEQSLLTLVIGQAKRNNESPTARYNKTATPVNP